MTKITPVILSGGSGTRLWPLSRKSFPKQFVRFAGEHTLLQSAALRMAGAEFVAPMIITGSDYRFIVTEQLLAVGIDPGTIMVEPEGRNTAPAVLAAALHAVKSDPDAVLLVAPSDHVIPDAEAFRAAVQRGLEAVKAGRLVTFGITPDKPETGYGYLELAEAPEGDESPKPLLRFVEKPDAARAAEMLEAGNYLWNAGIFLFAAADMIAAFEAHAPEMIAPVQAALDDAEIDLGFLRLAPAAWADVPSDSIDYSVMEKSPLLSVVPFGARWSDLGSWSAVQDEMDADTSGVALSGNATAIECENTLLRAESADQQLVAIGVRDLIVVAMDDAVLVADKTRGQDVKRAVQALKDKNATQAELFPMDHRPWGSFETLALAERFQVKRIVVKPGAALSLQSHHHRSEHWIVVHGTAKVTVNDEVKLVAENESVYIPLGAKHRMENPGKLPMVLIEVQTGSYLGEDDIIRYEDIYARGQGAKG
ncbi:mannose-1-phosphate guanylyltransferase/mannose-6-phosphate isomerase [Lentibacter sp. XHP0401]|uniref:mannose-1-phosphate guanylyltransferase/mannose-6-phosphate isomerase n=1 Tax=Lentibacter sp. XHP0401 TaxID=2984334 RepID=UPI0021E9A9D3|nr:mannose-1-phosphate guanylyltransferase/mannose-6-phosphate isomerase [Lentibacter sp. XHP0401]MCV2894799.1 mannose-1-phosphate guanylyltransferase/mannose-6-phosphate isomerase [Lentibacter sp. XHP0401]